jgi:hypothetical protein
METTKNELPKNVKEFFYHLSDYLDTKLLYFGSVQRSDYVSGKSDIDIDIFSENEYSLMTKMQHYLHVSKHDFKKVAWIINDIPTYGYKLQYENKKENINAEFSIYNEKFKDIIIKEHQSKFVLPLHVTIMLYIVKFFYYEIPLLDKKTFSNTKRYIMNSQLEKNGNTRFLVLDST